MHSRRLWRRRSQQRFCPRSQVGRRQSPEPSNPAEYNWNAPWQNCSMRAIRLVPALDPSHPDYPVIKQIETALLAQAGGVARIKEDLPMLIRQSIDEVIDTPRTGRVHARDLEKTEKTYIGTKVEILVRNYFRLPKGILDLRVAGHDVDVKNTLGQTWMIPREAIDKPCILVASDEPRKLCYFGIFIAHPSNLTHGRNQDLKHSVSVAGFANIHWIFKEEPYPL